VIAQIAGIPRVLCSQDHPVTVRRWYAAWQPEMSISRLAWRAALAASRRARGARCSSRSPFHANASAHARSHLEHDALAEARVGRAPARHPPGARGAACAHTACGGSTLVLSCKLTRARVLLRADDRASLAPRWPARNLVRKPPGGARQIARELRRRLLPFVLYVEYGHGSDIEEMRARFPTLPAPFPHLLVTFPIHMVHISNTYWSHFHTYWCTLSVQLFRRGNRHGSCERFSTFLLLCTRSFLYVLVIGRRACAKKP
jgi:hypothetical protein